jgi:Flp pilus assembly pilin Flp
VKFEARRFDPRGQAGQTMAEYATVLGLVTLAVVFVGLAGGISSAAASVSGLL